jgi:hypothetical protein
MDEEVFYSDQEDESINQQLKKEIFISDCLYDLIDFLSSIKEVIPYYSKLSTSKIACKIIDHILNENLNKNYKKYEYSNEYRDLLIFIHENISNIINTNKKYYGIKNEYTISFDDIYKLLN